MIREIVRHLRQRFWPIGVPRRPVLDLVDFGSQRCYVLDVGANRGGFAANILLRAPLARVICFEPNHELQAHLRQKVASFGQHFGAPRCEVVEAAAGDREEMSELLVTGLDAASSLLPVSDVCQKGWPNADFSVVDSQRVRVLRLDHFLDSRGISDIKLLKLDVQGFELAALRGCSGRLADVEHILCEIQFWPLYEGAPVWHEVVAFLRPYGFTPVVMDGFCFSPDGLPLQADLLFRNSGWRSR